MKFHNEQALVLKAKCGGEAILTMRTPEGYKSGVYIHDFKEIKIKTKKTSLRFFIRPTQFDLITPCWGRKTLLKHIYAQDFEKVLELYRR